MRLWLAGLLFVSSGVAWCFACSSFQGGDEAPPSDAGQGDAGIDATYASDSAPDVVVDGAAPALGSNCKAILELDKTRQGIDGVYTIAPSRADAGEAGAGETLAVYCDMTLDKGGWTLVGRSAPGAQSLTFGWDSKDGIVTEPRFPYSLGARGAGLVFGEVLVVGFGAAGVMDRAYKFRVEPGFLEARTDSGVSVAPVVSLAGDCDPKEGGPSTLQNAGGTAFADAFFLRDLPDVTTLHAGLTPSGFFVNQDDCMRGGSLTGLQGAIFVR